MKTATSLSHLRFRWEGPLAGFVAVGLAALVGTGIASAQTASAAGHSTAAMQAVASAHPQAAAAPVRHGEDESEAKLDDASHQGIKIHGHWKIDIKNPDGSLASTHEFENSLIDNGALFTYLLTSQATSGAAAVGLTANPTTYGNAWPIYENSAAAVSFCTNATAAGDGCSTNLNVSPVLTPLETVGQISIYSYSVALSGSVVAPGNATITSVFTNFNSCSTGGSYATVTPAQCHAYGSLPAGSGYGLPSSNTSGFTGTTVSNIQVLSGQTIQVTVTLSFS